jgi:DNA-binding NarL/FixJ family response regulator
MRESQRADVVRVLLADDQHVVRAGFRLVLEQDERIEIVGEASNGAETVKLARRLHPDIVLMDIRMPVLDGLEATRQILDDERTSEVRVVVLTTFDLDDFVFDALRAGASGFLLKEIEPNELRQAVRLAAAGQGLLSPSVTQRVIAEFSAKRDPRPKEPERLDRLTVREREVVALVAEGLNNEEIGERLFMSPATAKTHVSRAMTKLHARDRAQVVVIAYETGLAGH